ncbi:hypothetical protein ABT369_32800 [Dactylosporangium sp. NPDC000244]|uniref:hypothetical protein n=1 Tax=Dactylosporangium sp. NPDC000244 TaxID=3154365 RepID=UPI003321E9D0
MVVRQPRPPSSRVRPRCWVTATKRASAVTPSMVRVAVGGSERHGTLTVAAISPPVRSW